jgi:hypothetical protein
MGREPVIEAISLFKYNILYSDNNGITNTTLSIFKYLIFFYNQKTLIYRRVRAEHGTHMYLLYYIYSKY